MKFIRRFVEKQLMDFLINTPPERILKIGDNKLVRAFQNASKDIPAYQYILKKYNVDPKTVKDIEDFRKKVPVIDKKIFSQYDISELCRGGIMSNISRVLISSGFSGSHSYGLWPERSNLIKSCMLDAFIDYEFNVRKRKTFFINALGMGVKIGVDLPMAETSVKPQSVIALIKKFSGHFEQFILVANSFFIKKILEDGMEKGVDWKKTIIHCIIGEDWFPENYRTYLGEILGIDFDRPENGSIYSSMGMTEIGGLSILQECKEKVLIRRKAEKNKKIRSEIFGPKYDVCPLFFHYHPYFVMLEEMNRELIFTTLQRDEMIPLIRYNSHDHGSLYSYNDIKTKLEALGLDVLVPKLKLPMVGIMGREGKSVRVHDKEISPELVKKAIYSSYDTASKTTGYFKVGIKNGRFFIEIQLKDKIDVSAKVAKMYHDNICEVTGVDLDLKAYKYGDFPYGMGLIYENKFSYI